MDSAAGVAGVLVHRRVVGEQTLGLSERIASSLPAGSADYGAPAWTCA